MVGKINKYLIQSTHEELIECKQLAYGSSLLSELNLHVTAAAVAC